MRYDKTVNFIEKYNGEYDYETGNIIGEKIIKTPKEVNITDANLETQQMIFGKIKEGALVVRLKNPVSDRYDYLEIDGEIYDVQMIRTYRQKQTYYVVKRL